MLLCNYVSHWLGTSLESALWYFSAYSLVLLMWCYVNLVISPGVGVTAPFVNFSVSKIFDLAKVLLISFESHLYLTGVTAPLMILKNLENNGTEEIGLVTPTPVQ